LKLNHRGTALENGMAGRTDNRSLWEFALALYSSPGVEETVLSLQDEAGVNVNILLWSCWLESRGIRMNPATLAQAQAVISDWEAQVVSPLRRLRRKLKPLAAEDDLGGELRNHIKDAELLAERRCLELLNAVDLSGASRDPAPGENAFAYLGHIGARGELSPLLIALERLIRYS
jgi:uncharacterized protein (TIGR02444 family)